MRRFCPADRACILGGCLPTRNGFKKGWPEGFGGGARAAMPPDAKHGTGQELTQRQVDAHTSACSPPEALRPPRIIDEPGQAPPRRRRFLQLMVATATAAVASLGMPSAAPARRSHKKNHQGALVYRFTTRRHRSCRACQRHHRFMVFVRTRWPTHTAHIPAAIARSSVTRCRPSSTGGSSAGGAPRPRAWSTSGSSASTTSRALEAPARGACAAAKGLSLVASSGPRARTLGNCRRSPPSPASPRIRGHGPPRRMTPRTERATW